MKYSSSIALLIFSAFQVHFILTNELNYEEKIAKLSKSQNTIKMKVENLTAYMQKEHDYTYEELHNLAKSFVEVMITNGMTEYGQIQNIKQTKDCLNTSWCVNQALSTVFQLIDKEKKFMPLLADEHIKNITENNQLTNISKMGMELLFIVNSEVDINNSGCLKNCTSYINADDCLDHKIRKVEFFLDSCIEYEKNLGIEKSSTLKKKVEDAYFKMDAEQIMLLKQLGKIKPTFHKCTVECTIGNEYLTSNDTDNNNNNLTNIYLENNV